MIIGFSMERLTNFLCHIYHISSFLYFILYIWGRAWYKLKYECDFSQQFTQFQQWGVKSTTFVMKDRVMVRPFSDDFPRGLFWVCIDVGPYNHIQMSFSHGRRSESASFRWRGERNIRLFASPDRLHHFPATTNFNRPWRISLTLTV
jgi:hypothetical protein